MQIAIIVEGATERAFRETLNEFLVQRLSPGDRPRIRFILSNGRLPKGDQLKRDVERLLKRCDAVIALTDVYTGDDPGDFADAADAKAKMRRWVGNESRFYPHAAQYEFEAWLLPYWPTIQRLAGSNRASLARDPEAVNHQKPPSKHLQEVFRTGKRKRAYEKIVDGIAILRDQDLAIAAAVCPELKAFLNTILTLSGGTALT